MIRNILNVIIVIFIFLFLFFVISTYLSDKNINKIKSNRLIVEDNIEHKKLDCLLFFLKPYQNQNLAQHHCFYLTS